MKLISFNSGQLQNNSFNGAMLIKTNRVIRFVNIMSVLGHNVAHISYLIRGTLWLALLTQKVGNLFKTNQELL